jgi:hypothetical protein
MSISESSLLIVNNPGRTPDVDVLNQLFDFNVSNGVGTWKTTTRKGKDVTRVSTRGKGKPPKCISVMINGKNYKWQRIVWKMITGFDSPYHIEHKNGDCTDNRFFNLQESTHIVSARRSKAALKSCT